MRSDSVNNKNNNQCLKSVHNVTLFSVKKNKRSQSDSINNKNNNQCLKSVRNVTLFSIKK